MAIYLRELKEIFVVPAYATNCLATLIVYPIMLGVLFLGMGQGLQGMEEISALIPYIKELSKTLYLAVAAAVLSLTCSMNMAVSTAVSREGKYHSFSRILPVAGKTMLLAKLCMGLTLSGAASLLMAAVLWVFLPMFWLETLIALPISGLFSLMTCALALILDAYRPNFSWKSEMEAVKRSVNGMMAMFGAVLVLALLVALYFLLQSFGFAPMGNLAVLIGLMAVLDGLFLWWLKGGAATAYSLQEKFN
jgi:ABC-2 type transport system permease protein